MAILDEDFRDRQAYRPFMGMWVRVSPLVPKGRTVVIGEHSTVIFHDRYDYTTAAFWLKVGPHLKVLNEEALGRWERVKLESKYRAWRGSAPTTNRN